MPNDNGSKIRKICPNCNIEYWVYPSELNKRNFCSKECRKEYNWEDRICPHCNKVFHVRKSSKVKFCSMKCSREYTRNKGLESRVCKNCNNEFKILKSSDNLCCCDECYKEWKTKHSKARVNCDCCGKSFLIPQHRLKNNTRGYYCSPECSQKSQIKGEYVICKNCGKTIYKMQSKISENNFCNSKCMSEYSHKINYTTKKCEMCGKEYEVKNSRASKSRFCCVACQGKWQSMFRVGENSPTWKGGLIDYPCDYCGNIVKIKQHRLKSDNCHFCSYECRDLFYSIKENRTEKQKLSDERLAKDGIKYIKPYFSKPHQLISRYLESENIIFENEKIAHYYRLDIYLSEENLTIEVNGDFWHCNPNRYKEIKYERQLKTIYKDKSKDTYIRNKYGHNILYLWEMDILNNIELCQKLIKLYIDNKGFLPNYNSFNYELIDNNIHLKEELITPYQCMKNEEIKKYTSTMKTA